MNEGLIPRRYAKALYKVALERKSDSRLYELMTNLADAYSASPLLRDIIANPFVDVKDKTDAISAAAKSNAEDTTFADFLKLLITNRRIELCGDIAYAYISYYREEHNIKRVEVVSAAPLDSSVEKRIKSIIEQHLHGGSMEFSTKVDSDLIGGFVITVDNERLDASLKNQLKEIRFNLLNN